MSITAGKYGAVRIQRIWEALGKPVLPSTDSICYSDNKTKTFVWIARGADDSKLARGIAIATFKNCVDQPVHRARGFSRWQTEKGIGLGSQERQVLLAYGRPSAVKTPDRDPTAFLDAFNRADNIARMLERVPRAWRVLRYDGGPDSLSVSEFGIVAGKVQWIWLSDNE